MTCQDVAVGIDLGGTNLKVGVVDGDGGIRAQRGSAVDVTRGAAHTIAQIADVVDALLAEVSLPRSALIAVGLGAPGPLSMREGRIIKAANLPLRLRPARLP